MWEPRNPAPPLIRQVLIPAQDTGAGGTGGAVGIGFGVGHATVDGNRAQAAVELLSAHRAVLRRVARRHSLCDEDAEDALQRASVILLTKAPAIDPGRLIAWMVVVTRHEAMAVRAARERVLAACAPEWAGADPVESVPAGTPDPATRLERVSAAREALSALKANERLAIVLQAQGYSYVEIGERCGWSYTKVNRCLAGGRARLRSELARSAPGN
jgi:RNA polymerase sigma factor (sigma-70 family)